VRHDDRPRWGVISHRRLMDAIVASVPRDPLQRIEAAVVTHLVRQVVSRPVGSAPSTSVATTYHWALATRVAEVIKCRFAAATITCQPHGRSPDNRVRFDVEVPSAPTEEVAKWLNELWKAVPPRVEPEVSQHGRAAAARTIWRAALLVSSSYPRRAQIRIWLPDAESVSVLCRGGDALGVTVTPHRRRRNCHLVTVDDPAESIQLLRAVGAGPHADAWVCHRARVH
jgi:hypothetical protein